MVLHQTPNLDDEGSSPSVPAFVTVMVDSVSFFLLLYGESPSALSQRGILLYIDVPSTLRRCSIDASQMFYRRLKPVFVTLTPRLIKYTIDGFNARFEAFITVRSLVEEQVKVMLSKSQLVLICDWDGSSAMAFHT